MPRIWRQIFGGGQNLESDLRGVFEYDFFAIPIDLLFSKGFSVDLLMIFKILVICAISMQRLLELPCHLRHTGFLCSI